MHYTMRQAQDCLSTEGTKTEVKGAQRALLRNLGLIGDCMTIDRIWVLTIKLLIVLSSVTRAECMHCK